MSHNQKNGKYCQHCGSLIPASCFYCPKCNKVSESYRPTPQHFNGTANGKFCQNCGAFIPVSSLLCPQCNKLSESHRPSHSTSNGTAIIALILSFVFPILGLFLGLKGKEKAEEGASGMALSIAAITISIISMAANLLLLF